jgi:hypothetical protein
MDLNPHDPDEAYEVSIPTMYPMDLNIILRGLALAAQDAAVHNRMDMANRAVALQSYLAHCGPHLYADARHDSGMMVRDDEYDSPLAAVGFRGDERLAEIREDFDTFGWNHPDIPESVFERASETDIDIE